MSEPFVGEIRMVGFTFNPRGWAYCAGQLLPIAQNQALFALLGTTYGGNGQTNFALPDLRGRVPVGATNTSGSPLPPVQVAQTGGTPQVQLTMNELPMHNHLATFTGTGGGGGSSPQVAVKVGVTSTTGTLNTPGGNVLAAAPTAGPNQALVYAPSTANLDGELAGISVAVTGGGGGGITGGTVTVNPSGGGQPFSIMPPFIGINFVIALEGIFPSRS